MTFIDRFVNLCVSVPPLHRPGIPSGGQLCGENAGADPGPAVQGVWSPVWSSARGPAAVRSSVGQTDGVTDPSPQLPPPDETAASAQMKGRRTKYSWNSAVLCFYISLKLGFKM